MQATSLPASSISVALATLLHLVYASSATFFVFLFCSWCWLAPSCCLELCSFMCFLMPRDESSRALLFCSFFWFVWYCRNHLLSVAGISFFVYCSFCII